MWNVEPAGGTPRYIHVDTPVHTRYELSEPRTDFANLGAIMMDMDGSSTDTEKLCLEALRLMVAEARSEPELRFAREDFPRVIGDSTTNHVRYLIRKYGLEPEHLDRYITNYYEHYHRVLYDIRDGKIAEKLIVPMPHLREFLTWARERGIKLGLVTSSLQEECDIVMAQVFKEMEVPMAFQEFYDGVISADAVGEPFLKPHPNLYVLMRERLGAPKERSIVIEDSTAGIAAGRIAGMGVFAVPHHATRDHDFSLANLGVMKRGLAEVREAIERAS